MRNLIIISLLLLSLPAAAQRRQVRFIDDIEINEERAGGPVISERDAQPLFKSGKHASQKVKKEDDHGDLPPAAGYIEDVSKLQFKYALITDREVESLKDDLLYDFIEDWWRTPYRMGGTSKAGVDCSGFSRELMRDVYEVEMPRTAREQFEETQRVPKDELKEGDLVFFYTGGPYISHVGVYLGNNYFVHSSTRSGVIISSLDEEYYHRHYRGAGRNPSKRTSSVAASR